VSIQIKGVPFRVRFRFVDPRTPSGSILFAQNHLKSDTMEPRSLINKQNSIENQQVIILFDIMLIIGFLYTCVLCVPGVCGVGAMSEQTTTHYINESQY